MNRLEQNQQTEENWDGEETWSHGSVKAFIRNWRLLPLVCEACGGLIS